LPSEKCCFCGCEPIDEVTVYIHKTLNSIQQYITSNVSSITHGQTGDLNHLCVLLDFYLLHLNSNSKIPETISVIITNYLELHSVIFKHIQFNDEHKTISDNI